MATATITVRGERSYESIGNILDWVSEARNIAQATSRPTVNVVVREQVVCVVTANKIDWKDRSAKQDYDTRYRRAFATAPD